MHIEHEAKGGLMNPFDLQGPEFLGFWLAGWVFVALVALAIRAYVSRTRSHEGVDVLAAKLHPTEVAYVFGGIERAIEAAVAGLHHRGVIDIEADGLLKLTAQARGSVLRPDGVFRGVIVGEEMSRVEGFVLERLPATIRDLCANSDAVDIVLRRKLEEQGLLVENQRAATRLVRAPAFLWMLVGAIKIAIGLSRDKPVFLLFVLMFGAAWALIVFRAPRLTSLGRLLERNMKRRYAALESTARSASQQLDAAEMTLAYGMFGYLVAPALLMSAMPSYHAAVLASTTTSGSSCGSAGCGGGCGGCGGCS
jgi:uncharacterized protein (TIGR04222 family)